MNREINWQQNELSHRIALVINDLIQKSGKAEKELQTLLEITPVALHKYLTGQKPLTIDQLATVAEWLHVPLVTLLNSTISGHNEALFEMHSNDQLVISIVVPVHNEERTVAQVVHQLASQTLSAKLELIVVDDGSTDRTAQILDELQHIYEVRVISLKRNQGKGNAVRAGIAAATGSHLLIFDADSEYDPADLEALITPIRRRRADLVFGVRVQGVNTTHPTLLHAFGNKAMTLSTNLLFGSSITDLHTCLKLVRLDLLRSFTLTEKGFGLDTEITAELLRRGFRPYEIPISYIGRSKAEGKHIKASDAIRCFYVLAKVRFRSKKSNPIAQPGLAHAHD